MLHFFLELELELIQNHMIQKNVAVATPVAQSKAKDLVASRGWAEKSANQEVMMVHSRYLLLLRRRRGQRLGSVAKMGRKGHKPGQ
jgi:hypothetical protein